MKSKLVNNFIIGTFVALYLLVSIISTIHVIDFFELSNPYWLAVTLAIGFELGAAASLASLVILDKMNKTLVWALFITITAMQMQGNMYYAFINLENFQGWVELFNLVEWEPLAQKRLLAAVSGAILPLVALGFIKSLVDYIKPDDSIKQIIEKSPEGEFEIDEDFDDEDEDEDLFWSEQEMADFRNQFEDVEDDIVNDYDSLFKNDVFQGETEDWELELEVEDEVEEPQHSWVDDLTEEELDQVAEEFANAEVFTIEEQVEEPINVIEEELSAETREEIVEEPIEQELAIETPVQEVEQKKEVSLEKIVEKKEPYTDIDATYKFGSNLYNTMVKKMSSDHLPKPSQEEITQAYRNLGLVNKPK